MDIFYNKIDPNYDQIVAMGPKWWTEYREMDANYLYAGWTLDLMADFLEKLVNNEFPSTCDRETLEMYERILDINPKETETFEERRRYVSMIISGKGKLSRLVIQNMIKNYSGCDSEVLWVDDSLHVRILYDEDVSFSVKTVYDSINRRMPAHIGLNMREMIATFELIELFTEKMRIRQPISWWEYVLDGSHVMDGSCDMSHTYPISFGTINRIVVVNPEYQEIWKQAVRLMVNSGEQISAVPIFRIDFPWWEGTNMLDGSHDFDGSIKLDQNRGPLWPETLLRSDIGTAENIGFRLVNPSNVCTMDGTISLNGTRYLYNGREDL